MGSTALSPTMSSPNIAVGICRSSQGDIAMTPPAIAYSKA